MSEATANITMRYQPLQGGDAESRWIRIEQERPEDEALTLDEAAEIIDTLYDLQPCDEGGMSGGGEEATEEAPDREKFDAAMRAMLRKSGVCKQAEYWIATVRVMRSHRQPGYVLRSETAEVETTTPVIESHRQFVEANGATIELDMPYEGGLTGIPAGIKWAVRGSTVNLDRPLRGSLVLRYNTYYERVTLRVPTTITTAPGGLPSGITTGLPGAAPTRAGLPGAAPTRAELPSAAVVAFWGDLAASCDLEPPDVDEGLSQGELDEICRRIDGGGGGIHDDSPKECWKSVTHYDRCNCSGKLVNVWTETVPASCDDAASESAFGNYVHCDGEEDENLLDPEYFERRCCHPPHAPLPRCRKTYAVYSGGHAIENGSEHWKNIYGQDAVMIAVTPKDGTCGELITEWIVPNKNCCDDVEPMTPHPDNPETITTPGAVKLCVNGGRFPYRWRASAGYYFEDGSQYIREGGACQTVYASEDACNNASIQVDDGCTRVHLPLTRANPEEELYLAPDEANMAPETWLTVDARNSQGEVYWSPGALELKAGQGTSRAVFYAPEGFCGQTAITASDACGRIAECLVLSTAGRWEEQFDFDPCSAPWSGEAPAGSNGVVESYQGWRAYVSTRSAKKNFAAPYGTCPQMGSCAEAAEGIVDAPCGYSGNQLTTIPGGCSPFEETYRWRRCYPLCNQYYSKQFWSATKCQELTNTWEAAVQWITRLWKWVCA